MRHPGALLPMALACACQPGLATAADTPASPSPSSSLTVFGVVDVGIRRLDNGGVRQTAVVSDANAPSRLGFRGTEDLGGGLSTGFWLEAGLDASTGQPANPAKFFHRRSTLSLASTSAGELRLGRDFTPTFLAYALYDPFYTSGVGAAFNVLAGPGFNNGSGALTTGRADNAVQYLSPAAWGPVRVHAMVAPSEGMAGSDYRGAKLSYTQGAWDASVSYGHTQVPAGAYTLATLGGSYQVRSDLKVSLVALRTGFNARHETARWIGVAYGIGPGEVRASWVAKNASGGGTNADDDRQLAVGYVHNLSRRTAVYTTVSRLRNRGASASVVAIGSSIAPGRTSTGMEFGLRHAF